MYKWRLLNFWDFGPPPSPCQKFWQIGSTKITQPPLLRQILTDPLPPSNIRRHLCMPPNYSNHVNLPAASCCTTVSLIEDRLSKPSCFAEKSLSILDPDCTEKVAEGFARSLADGKICCLPGNLAMTNWSNARVFLPLPATEGERQKKARKWKRGGGKTNRTR